MTWYFHISFSRSHFTSVQSFFFLSLLLIHKYLGIVSHTLFPFIAYGAYRMSFYGEEPQQMIHSCIKHNNFD